MPRNRGFAIILGLALAGLPALGQMTPPIEPNVQEAPVPPAIEIPAPPSVPADVPSRPLSAEEAALLALHHQPDLAAAQAAVTAAQVAVQVARSALGPAVSVSAGYNRTIGTSGGTGGTTTGGTSGVFSGTTATATIRQLLYDYNHTRDLVRQAVARERVAQAGLTQAQSNLVLLVKLAFYNYVQNQRLVGVAEDTVRNQQAHLALAQARLKVGLGLPYDVVRAQTAVADAIFNLTQARTNAILARVTLTQQIGIDPRTPLVSAEENESAPPAPDLNQLAQQALTRRPEIVQAQQSLQSARSGLSAAQTNNAPVVSGSAGWTDRDTSFPPNNSSFFVGVAATWTPFDSGLTKGLVTQGQAGVQAAQAQIDSATLGVLSDVTQSYLNLKTAEQHVATSETELANAQEGLRLAQGRYKAGLGVFLEVLDAENALVTAATNRVNALNALDQARAALAHSVNADPVVAGTGK